MKLDDLLVILGAFGKFQKIRFFLLCLFAIVSAWHALNMVFVGPAHEFSCDVTNLDLSHTPLENSTLSQREKLFLVGGDENKCFRYDVNSTLDVLKRSGFNQTSVSSENRSSVTCSDGYRFSTETTTITSDFDLVCDRKYWRSTSKSVFFAGRLLGAVIFGQLSDRVGRRPMFFVGVALLLVAGTVASLANSMLLFLPMYMLQGAAHTGAFLVSYTLSTELVGPEYRVLAGFVIQAFYSLGYMTLAGLAYLIPQWRHLELAITLPALLFGVYYWFLPESVRWLLSRDKDEEAEKIINAAAKQNGVTLDPDVIKALKLEPSLRVGDRKYHIVDCLRTWPMAKLSLNIWFNWLVNALVYYGLSLNTENLAGNVYLNFCVSGAVELPAYLLCVLILNRVGRRWPLIISMYLGGAACILSGLLPTDGQSGMETLVVALAMVGKIGITTSYAIIYLMGAEIFPTVIRNIGMGVSSMSARIGGILAPFILELQSVWKPLPLIIFGGMSILAGTLAYLLPETAGKPLPQLPEDVDHGKSCSFNMCRGKTNNKLTIDSKEMTNISADDTNL